MEMQKISARVELDDYSNRVLSIIKAKFGLRDKSQALNKFFLLYGEDILEREATDEYMKKIIGITNKHLKKYGTKSMSEKELNDLFEK
jgi:hypothetical protein